MVIYGRRPVAEAQRGRRRVHRTWTADQLSTEELTRLAGSPDHQGVVAEVDPYPYADPHGLLAGEDAIVLCLDQVQDPQNLGAVCRSAEFGGAAGVVICERRAAQVTPAVCKASAGAVEHLAIARAPNLTDWIAEAKAKGAWIYGASETGGAPYSSADLRGRLVLVMGAEGRGLRPRVAASCDALLSIPGRGRTASLNVGSAAAILLFEALRQRQ